MEKKQNKRLQETMRKRRYRSSKKEMQKVILYAESVNDDADELLSFSPAETYNQNTDFFNLNNKQGKPYNILRRAYTMT